LAFISCGNKPAYSNLNSSREVKEANQNSGQAAAVTAGDQSNASPSTGAQENANAAASQPQPFKPPKFMANGQAKDLPNYPQAITKSIQYGPVQGTDTMSLVLETRDPIEKVIAFYDKAIKSNGWTVEGKMANEEMAEWTLKKTFDNEGKVQVKKDPRLNAWNIVIVRTEKIAQ
jgi:hypothetical protein